MSEINITHMGNKRIWELSSNRSNRAGAKIGKKTPVRSLEAKMSAMENLFITRRSILTAAALGGLSLITPNGAFADGCDSETVEFLAFPDLSESDVEAIVRQRAEQEAALIIEEAMSSDGVEPYATRGRPSYSTVYGSVQTKASGWHDVAGQPPGGRSHRRCRLLESDGERRAQGSAVCCLRDRQRRQEGVQKSSDE